MFLKKNNYRWDDVKYRNFTLTIDDPNEPDSYERI